MRCSRRFDSVVRQWCRSRERSVKDLSARYLDAHFEAVAGGTWNRSAARLMAAPVVNVQGRETSSTDWGEGCVSVRHEDLRLRGECGNPHPAGGLHLSRVFTTSQGTTARACLTNGVALRCPRSQRSLRCRRWLCHQQSRLLRLAITNFGRILASTTICQTCPSCRQPGAARRAPRRVRCGESLRGAHSRLSSECGSLSRARRAARCLRSG